MLDELSIIDRYFRPLAGEGAFGLRDDAAAISPPVGSDLVITVDTIAEDVHFLPGDPPGTIARKALRVNLSDLAAKGAKPVGYVLALSLGPSVDDVWLAGFAEGLKLDQAEFQVTLLGGDTISASATIISITAFGTVPAGRMVHRFGGKPGDQLYVSGTIGAGGAGLALLKGEDGPWNALAEAGQEKLVERYRVPQPRLALAPALLAHASAAMDISDGLVGDCDKLAAASGCSADIDVARVPLPEDFRSNLDDDILAHLITAGDDYEILAAVPPGSAGAFEAAAAVAGVLVTRIGALTPGPGPTRVALHGEPLSLTRRSYIHGRH